MLKNFKTLFRKNIFSLNAQNILFPLQDRKNLGCDVNSKKYSQSGMTLIEIMIVLGIIGALMAVLLPQVTSKLNKSKVSDTKIRIGQVSNALNLYFTDCGKFPESLDNLTTADANCTNWGPDPYIKKDLLKDAWQRPMTYSVEGSAFVIKSLGADGREGGTGFDKDITSEDSGS